jgi:5-formyltetrahydrofolate cyclo-ligase
MASPSPASDKAQLRSTARAARARVGLVPRAAAGVRLWAHLRGLRGEVIAGYLPMGSEASPVGAMRAWSRENRICVPVPQPAGPLRFREWWPGCPLEAGPHGVPVPTEGAWRVPGVVVVPMVAFDMEGRRLGQGGGHYDRTLAADASIRAVGLALWAQRVEAVPAEPHDVALREIVTEKGVLRADPPV